MFTGIVKVALSAPIKWMDRTISVIELDFGKVNGGIINQCEREVFQGGNFSGLVRSLSAEYCGRMAAYISDVPFRAFEKLPGDDYDKIWQTVGAYVGKHDPQEFYDQFTEGDDEGFTVPAAEQEQVKPDKSDKPGKSTKT